MAKIEHNRRMSKQPDTPPKSPLQIALEPLDVRDVSRSLYGVPLKTVYRWRDGTRVPPAWLQSLILAALGPIRLEYEQKKKLTDGENAE